jgi:hypothetical protein
MGGTPRSPWLVYPDAPFVEEFVDRFGVRPPGLIWKASHDYRRRGQGSIPRWEHWCYLPVNVAVGYCLGLGMDAEAASLNARYLATAQAFLASQLIVELDATELRETWCAPTVGPIPFDALTDVPAFCYYIDLAPIETEAHGCGVFVSWEDRFGMAETRGMSLHLTRGLRLTERTGGGWFLPHPIEIPLLRDRTVRECIYKFLDDALYNGVDASCPRVQKALDGLESTIEDAGRLLALVSLVNRKLADEEERAKRFRPVVFEKGVAVVPECVRLRL